MTADPMELFRAYKTALMRNRYETQAERQRRFMRVHRQVKRAVIDAERKPIFDVARVRALLMLRGHTFTSIARKHGVSDAMVNYAIRGKRTSKTALAILKTIREETGL